MYVQSFGCSTRTVSFIHSSSAVCCIVNHSLWCISTTFHWMNCGERHFKQDFYCILHASSLIHSLHTHEIQMAKGWERGALTIVASTYVCICHWHAYARTQHIQKQLHQINVKWFILEYVGVFNHRWTYMHHHNFNLVRHSSSEWRASQFITSVGSSMENRWQRWFYLYYFYYFNARISSEPQQTIIIAWAFRSLGIPICHAFNDWNRNSRPHDSSGPLAHTHTRIPTP